MAPSRARLDFSRPWDATSTLSELDASWGDPPAFSEPVSLETDECGVEDLYDERLEPRAVPTSLQPWLLQDTLPAAPRVQAPTGWLETPRGTRVAGSSLARGRVTLGRDPRCHVVVADPSCSREHAEIVLRDGVVWLFDRSSKNGVAVNGGRIYQVPLQDGDEISLGGLRFTWCCGRSRGRSGRPVPAGRPRR